jgi:hypothetical protein
MKKNREWSCSVGCLPLFVIAFFLWWFVVWVFILPRGAWAM